MALYKRGDTYWMDRVIEGRRYRESLETGCYQEAVDAQDKRVAEIRGRVEIPSGVAVLKSLFPVAGAAYLKAKAGEVSESTSETERQLLKPLCAFFAKTKTRKVSAAQVLVYRQERLSSVSPSTINQEVGLLKRVLRRSGRELDVKALLVSGEVGRALTPEQKCRLFDLAATKRSWRRAFLAARLAVATGMRTSELRRLRWTEVGEVITVLRSSTKTNKGARVIPVNEKAAAALAELRELNAGGKVVPFLSWRSAWRSMVTAAGLDGLRFHDLRHQVATELAESGASDQTILDLMGHVSRKMLEHYSHVRLEAKRKAMEGLG